MSSLGPRSRKGARVNRLKALPHPSTSSKQSKKLTPCKVALSTFQKLTKSPSLPIPLLHQVQRFQVSAIKVDNQRLRSHPSLTSAHAIRANAKSLTDTSSKSLLRYMTALHPHFYLQNIIDFSTWSAMRKLKCENLSLRDKRIHGVREHATAWRGWYIRRLVA